MKAYTTFAKVYDSFMRDIPYGRWCHSIVAYLKQHGYETARILELGCGTGSMTIRLARVGYTMIGTDISAEMLERAKKRSVKANVKIQYDIQDMRAIDLEEEVDVVLSVCDSMNYLMDLEELQATLEGAYRTLREGGCFLFDMKTRAFYQSLGDATFTDTNEHGTYIWENEFDEESGNNYYDLTFFLARPLGLFAKQTEEHVQHVFAAEDVLRLAKECGFKEAVQYGMDIKSEADETAERTYFVMTK